MSNFLVQPIGAVPIPGYVGHIYGIDSGYVIEARSRVAAAKAVMGACTPWLRRYGVHGPDGFNIVDLAPIEGCETLMLDEGPHR